MPKLEEKENSKRGLFRKGSVQRFTRQKNHDEVTSSHSRWCGRRGEKASNRRSLRRALGAGDLRFCVEGSTTGLSLCSCFSSASLSFEKKKSLKGLPNKECLSESVGEGERGIDCQGGGRARGAVSVLTTKRRDCDHPDSEENGCKRR